MSGTRASVAAIVLAAGESKRMGAENKLLLPYREQPVIEHVVDAVTQSEAKHVYVVVGHEQERVREALAGYDVTFVENPVYEEGMGTSIRAGVQAIEIEVEGIMMCLSDLPLVTPEEYTFLIESFATALRTDREAIAVPHYSGQRGNPVLLSAAYRTAMLGQQGVMGCRGIVKQHPTHVIPVDMVYDHVVSDIDTPEAYNQLLHRSKTVA